MKKTLLVGLALCSLLNVGIIASTASACIGPDGKPVEGTDGDVTNCVTAAEEAPVDPFIVSTESIDFGYMSELGRSYTQTFTITNNREGAVAVKVSPEKPEVEGLKDENKLGADWMVVVGGVKYFEIPANTSKTVGLRVVVPSDAKPGSQYVKLIVENTTANETYEIDVRMTVATEGLAFGGEVAGSSARPLGLDEKLNANMTVKNGGNAGFEAEYSVRAKSKFAAETDGWKENIYTKKAEVYPGAEVKFEVPSDEVEKLGFGLYTVEQKVVYVNAKGEKIEEVSTRTVLNLPIWALIVAGVVILLAILIPIIVKAVKKKKSDDDEEDDDEEEEEEHPKKAKKAAKKAAKSAKKAAKPAKAKKEKKVDFELDEEDIED